MQQLGETGDAMAKGFMDELQKVLDENPRDDHYWILVHAKPLLNQNYLGKHAIRQVFVKMNYEPPPLLGTIRIFVDNKKGAYKMEVFPHDVPIDESVYEKGEVSPEIYESSFKLGNCIMY